MTSLYDDTGVEYPQYKVEEGEMPVIRCVKCGYDLQILLDGWARGVVGSCLCNNCKSQTGFEIEGKAVVFVSGKSYGNFNDDVPDKSRAFYAEAESCFFMGNPNASAAMCRASIESGLTEAGFEGKDLYNKIENAKKSEQSNALSDVEASLAHGSRLITRDSIHRLELVNLSDVPSMLSAVVHILNKLFPD